MDIKEIKREYDNLLEQLSNPELISNREKFEKKLKKKEFLEKIISENEELEELLNKIKENESIVSAKEDQELISLAETENSQLREKKETLEKELKNLLSNYNPETENDDKDKLFSLNKQSNKEVAVIMEIRAGTGGEEAALFALDLFKMYTKYAQSKNWKVKILDSRVTELGGFKEMIFELSTKGGSALGGKKGDIYSKMKYEAGVHRVQRIPITEKSGRIHTSTATVAVLPRPKKSEIQIRPQDLKIDFYRASGPGGQYVNKKETAVRILHLPTGLVVTSQTERSQAQNKENAMSILEARILEKIQEKEELKIAKERKTQIGWAKRAEKIRTYNFPQNRITDHRIKKSWHNIEEIIGGKLEPIILALQKSLNV